MDAGVKTRTGICILVLSLFGIFGNLNIVIAILRKKNFRSKSGLLIGLIAVYDLICLIFECTVAVRDILRIELSSTECFKAVVVYYVVQFVSASTLIGLAVDRLVAVTFPFSYATHHVGYTLALSTLPGLMISVGFAIAAALFLEDDGKLSPVCFPVSMLPNFMQIYSGWCLFVMNAAVVVIYIAAFTSLHIQKRRISIKYNHQLKNTLQNQEKAMKSITVFLAVFLFTWFLFQFELTVMPLFEVPDTWIFNAIRATTPLTLIVAFSQCYYVYFWRSREYREAFLEQLGYGRWKKKAELRRSETRSTVTQF